MRRFAADRSDGPDRHARGGVPHPQYGERRQTVEVGATATADVTGVRPRRRRCRRRHLDSPAPPPLPPVATPGAAPRLLRLSARRAAVRFNPIRQAQGLRRPPSLRACCSAPVCMGRSVVMPLAPRRRRHRAPRSNPEIGQPGRRVGADPRGAGREDADLAKVAATTS
jgi:hypothetical protein